MTYLSNNSQPIGSIYIPTQFCCTKNLKSEKHGFNYVSLITK